MSRKRSAVDTRRKQLSEDEFMAKYGRETEEGDAADRGQGNTTLAELLGYFERGESPIRSALPHLNRWWLVRQLRAASGRR